MLLQNQKEHLIVSQDHQSDLVNSSQDHSKGKGGMLYTRAQTLLAPLSTSKALSGQSHKDDQTSSFGESSPAVRD